MRNRKGTTRRHRSFNGFHRVTQGTMYGSATVREGSIVIFSAPKVAPAMKVHLTGPDTMNEPNFNREIASLSARAAEVFGSREKAMRWLDTPVPSLGNRTPFSLISTAKGMADLEDTLGAIEHGIW